MLSCVVKHRLTRLFAVGSVLGCCACNASEDQAAAQTTKVVRQPAVARDGVVVWAVPGGYEVEVRSRAGFPPGAYDPVLYVGSHSFRRVRYLAVPDLQAISYSISAAEFAQIESGAPIRVAYPHSPERSFGVLDKNAVLPKGTP